MSEKGYVPPYTITDKTVNLISAITEIITKITINDNMSNNPRLRRDNRIRTIHASLAIENNSLSLDQVTDIINGKRILGAPDEICEVKNAFEAYNRLLEMNPYSIKDMLLAHKVLMNELTKEAGTFRSGGVGVFAGEQLVHMAPPANQVPHLMKELVDWAKRAEVHPLIKSCVFHYEFKFIHPFVDGNGRMGRLWQTVILKDYSPVFEFLPIESLIKERQQDYYDVLGKSDNQGNSTRFIEFMLKIINIALEDLLKTQNRTLTGTDRINIFKNFIGNELFTRQDYLRHNKEISTATASRDLKEAVDNDIIEKTGDKRLTKYRYKKTVPNT